MISQSVKVRSSLTTETTETLVHAFISSRLDYCNSLLYGINDGLLKKLQAVQNAAARVTTKTRKFDHITPVLYAVMGINYSKSSLTTITFSITL